MSLFYIMNRYNVPVTLDERAEKILHLASGGAEARCGGDLLQCIYASSSYHLCVFFLNLVISKLTSPTISRMVDLMLGWIGEVIDRFG